MTTASSIAKGVLVAALALGIAAIPSCQTVRADVLSDDSPQWDCRHMGDQECGPNNAQGVLPGWYGDDDCWPGAIWCPDIDAPYSPERVHPGALKLHTWTGGDAGPGDPRDLGPSLMGCEINLYTAQIDCSGAAHGADWDTDPASYGFTP